MASHSRGAQTDSTSDSAAAELAGARVAILAETLYEDPELWYPYYRLREAGADVFVVGSGSAETYQSKHGYPVTVDAEAQTAALDSEIERRGITPISERFDVPDRDLWEPGYAAAASDSVLAVGRTLDEALGIVAPFIDPLLSGAAAGSWDPKTGQWLT